MESYEKLTLPNGVRILYEKIPYVRSVSAGIWVGTGSRFEKAAENGISHFIEHMVFKGAVGENFRRKSFERIAVADDHSRLFESSDEIFSTLYVNSCFSAD